MSFEQRDRTGAALPIPPFGPAPPTAPPRPATWTRVRAALLIVAFAAAVALAVLALVQHRLIFLAAASTFAVLPVAYLGAAALRTPRVATRVAGLAGAGLLAGALVASTIVAIGGCEQRLGPDADLAGCDLRDAALAGEDLTGSNLTGADLSGTVLAGTNLDGADLTGASLSGADLSGAELDGANLSRADLTAASLEDASLVESVLAGARLEGATLLETNLRGADLSEARLASVDLSATTLTGVALAGADLTGADLHGAGLSGVNLRAAVATEANLAEAGLRGADLSGAALDRAALDRADLRDAVLAGANLAGATLVGASLEGADLTGAALAGADVSNTSMIGAAGVTDDGLAAAFDIDLEGLGGTLIERNVRLEDRDAILVAVGPACGGGEVAGAGSYVHGAFNPMVVLGAAGRAQPGFTDQPPVLGWEPTAARFVNVVACVGDEEIVTVESCPYVLEDGGPATIVRERFERRLLLVDPRSGSVLLDRTVQGSTPQMCPPTHLFGSSRTDTFQGTHVDFNAIQRDLTRFVEGRG